MMLSPSERLEIDLMSVFGRFEDVIRVSKDMMEFTYHEIKVTLYPNGSVMFYHFTDLEKGRLYADEVIAKARQDGNDED